ncbi:MAG: hypothetical protein Q7U12_17030 [Undibacterium sp.]|nr:hypothetical protein [Undibacterium sp.]
MSVEPACGGQRACRQVACRIAHADRACRAASARAYRRSRLRGQRAQADRARCRVAHCDAAGVAARATRGRTGPAAGRYRAGLRDAVGGGN